jgi:hypothetical protein
MKSDKKQEKAQKNFWNFVDMCGGNDGSAVQYWPLIGALSGLSPNKWPTLNGASA